ncbi:MAG TPA: hypothetical protein VEU07_09735, partial [Candidatus Acidoferrum sp.]|nr:hypothetical protein [Candidatus Acidoferrum sp.]
MPGRLNNRMGRLDSASGSARCFPGGSIRLDPLPLPILRLPHVPESLAFGGSAVVLHIEKALELGIRDFGPIEVEGLDSDLVLRQLRLMEFFASGLRIPCSLAFLIDLAHLFSRAPHPEGSARDEDHLGIIFSPGTLVERLEVDVHCLPSVDSHLDFSGPRLESLAAGGGLDQVCPHLNVLCQQISLRRSLSKLAAAKEDLDRLFRGANQQAAKTGDQLDLWWAGRGQGRGRLRRDTARRGRSGRRTPRPQEDELPLTGE